MSGRRKRPASPSGTGAGRRPALPAASPTLRKLLQYATQRFQASGLSFGHGSANARDEAAYLLLYAMGLPPHELEPFLGHKFNDAELERALQLIEARVTRRVPAAYLTHEAWLRGHRFYVDERAIVPRSFIAELLPTGLDPWLADPDSVQGILDMCTGSGCLAILAALAFPQAHVDAADVSADALQVARRNVDDYGLAARIELVETDLFKRLAGRRYDLILSNPPYVDAQSMKILPPEYRKEPELALAGGRNGLALVNRILREAGGHLRPNGILVVEIGHNRAALEDAYPRVEFAWLEVATGGDFVFLLTADQLAGLRPQPSLPLRGK